MTGRLKKDRVYCANMTELVALNLVTSRVNVAKQRWMLAQRIHAREKHSDNCKRSRNEESWARVGLLEKYDLCTRPSREEAGKFGVGKQRSCEESISIGGVR